uniref:hypothetical protein n=1 Tax=unclassified Rhodococcus (in: high G+C Gram-positive bacteria) TaxID=192944 RepID=UPI001595A4CD|nr:MULTISPECIES: hypothetical protein [unclassified Rhodococcus (in: high G+C Gram-positive bacteria)]
MPRPIEHQHHHAGAGAESTPHIWIPDSDRRRVSRTEEPTAAGMGKQNSDPDAWVVGAT